MRRLSYDPLWKKLIDLRMTKTDLAKKAGISRGIVTRMGKNEVVTLDAIIKICIALDCDVYDVLTMENVANSYHASGSNPSDGGK